MSKYINIVESKMTLNYKGAVHEFDIANIDRIFVSRKNIPYHGIIRAVLLLSLGPLLAYCLRADSLYVTGSCAAAYCLLYSAHDLRSYKLCVFTKDGKRTRIGIRRCEKKDFIEEVTCFLEEYPFR